MVCYWRYREVNRILITAGPTREPIDPVRFISNHSSGKMGYALATAAAEAGAEVVLISGPTCLTPPKGVKFISVITAAEMYQQVMQEVQACDVFIAVAAVADFRPATVLTQKLKKKNTTETLKLIANPDILAAVAALPNPPFTVGFAAETENVLANAKLKLNKADMIIANQVGHGVGFNQDENELLLLQKNKQAIKLSLAKKAVLAKQIIFHISVIFPQTSEAV